MGIGTTIKYDYKSLSEDFLRAIVTGMSNPYNTEAYYRFRSFQLINFLADATDNNKYGLDGDIPRLQSGTMYHLKKIGFSKSNQPREYKCFKAEIDNLLCTK